MADRTNAEKTKSKLEVFAKEHRKLITVVDAAITAMSLKGSYQLLVNEQSEGLYAWAYELLSEPNFDVDTFTMYMASFGYIVQFNAERFMSYTTTYIEITW